MEYIGRVSMASDEKKKLILLSFFVIFESDGILALTAAGAVVCKVAMSVLSSEFVEIITTQSVRISFLINNTKILLNAHRVDYESICNRCSVKKILKNPF